MSDLMRSVATTGLWLGAAWVLQSAGLGGGLLSQSPAFFIAGAAIMGGSAAALAWPQLDARFGAMCHAIEFAPASEGA